MFVRVPGEILLKNMAAYRVDFCYYSSLHMYLKNNAKLFTYRATLESITKDLLLNLEVKKVTIIFANFWASEGWKGYTYTPNSCSRDIVPLLGVGGGILKPVLFQNRLQQFSWLPNRASLAIRLLAQITKHLVKKLEYVDGLYLFLKGITLMLVTCVIRF